MASERPRSSQSKKVAKIVRKLRKFKHRSYAVKFIAPFLADIATALKTGMDSDGEATSYKVQAELLKIVARSLESSDTTSSAEIFSIAEAIEALKRESPGTRIYIHC